MMWTEDKKTENSEHELEDAYRDFKMAEIPDLWDRIEGNLSPRQGVPEQEGNLQTKEKEHEEKEYAEKEYAEKVSQGQKRGRFTRKTAPLAAVLLLTAVLVPTLYLIGRDGSGRKSGGSYYQEKSETSMDTAPGRADMEQTGQAADTSEAEEEEGTETEDGAETEEGAEIEAEKEGVTEDSDLESKSTENSQDMKALSSQIVLQIQVLSGQETEDIREGIISVKVLSDQSDVFKKDEVILLDYTDSEYVAGDFQGTLRIRIEKREKVNKVLEILP